MNQDQEKEENGWQSEGESLNTGSDASSQASAEGKENDGKAKKGGIHNNALFAASMGRAATAQVDPHSNSGLAQTGTNTSYEGATAPGAGGSAGSGYTSGQTGVDSSISTTSDYAQTQTGKSSEKNTDDDNEDDAKNTLI